MDLRFIGILIGIVIVGINVLYCISLTYGFLKWRKHFKKGTSYYDAGKYREAVMEYTKALQYAPWAIPVCSKRAHECIILANKKMNSAHNIYKR